MHNYDGVNVVMNHERMMKLALSEAQTAFLKDEVPIGAVLMDDNDQQLATAHNLTISLNDPTAHAEILVLRQAARRIQNYRLLNTTLYVTVEPCVMCMGAIIHSRVKTIVFGTRDPKWGAAGSIYDFSEQARFNHQPQIIEGICRKECRNLMQQFFKSKRKK
jgi:tRNA(adenine34) deaminase